MIQREGVVSIQMVENVQQKTIEPIIRATNSVDMQVYTDDYGTTTG